MLQIIEGKFKFVLLCINNEILPFPLELSTQSLIPGCGIVSGPSGT